MARRFVAERFPGAAVAVVAGSTASGTRTQTSDIDLLLIGDDILTSNASSLAATFAFEGEIFEVFAYTRHGFEQWARKGLAEYRPVLVHMLLEGVPIRGQTELSALQNEWRMVYLDGPLVATHDLELRRYAITDLLDDLRDATDTLERHVIAFTLFQRTAELVLLTERRWIGTGKHLPRRLRALSEERADALTQPLIGGDLHTFADRAEDELRRAGGRVEAGFVR